MADSHMVLNHLLCFLLSKYHKCEAKILKQTILSFYNSEDIHTATQLFLDVLNTVQDADKLSKTTRRRDSKERSVHEVDDLFSILAEMDEKQMLPALPTFVSNSGEKMPSSQLTDGDMRVIMRRFDDMEREISRLGQNVNNAVSAIKSTQLNNSTVRTPVPVNESYGSWPTVQQAAGMTASSKPAVNRQSRPKSDFVNEVVGGSWDAITAAEQAEQASSELSSCGDEQWQTVSGKSKKRRRIQQADTGLVTESPQNEIVRRTQQQRRVQPAAAVQSTNTTRPAAAAAAVRKRAPIVVGRMRSVDASNIVAAKPFLAKSTFYIENLSTDVTTVSLKSYIEKMGVDVLGCYEVKPRQSRWQREHNMTTLDRKSFRVCVPREDSEQFLNADNWPAHVAISRWIFKQRPDSQSSNDRGRSSTPAAATTSRAGVDSHVDAAAAAAAAAQSTPVTADVAARMSSSPRTRITVDHRLSSSSSSSNSTTASELDTTMIENHGGC